MMNCNCMNSEHYEGNMAEENIHHLLKIKTDFEDGSIDYICPYSQKRWVYWHKHPELQGGGIPQLDVVNDRHECIPQARTYAVTEILLNAKGREYLSRYTDGLIYAPVEFCGNKYIHYSMYIRFNYNTSSIDRITVLMAPVVERIANSVLRKNSSVIIKRGIQVVAEGSITDVVKVPTNEFVERFLGLCIKHNWHPEAVL